VVQSLLAKLGMVKSGAASLWCDNLGATYLSANPVFYAWIKHVEVDYRERVIRKQFDIRFISTNEQLYGFTKSLSQQRLKNFQYNINIGRLQARGMLEIKIVINLEVSLRDKFKSV
jgi:hypothetical protein